MRSDETVSGGVEPPVTPFSSLLSDDEWETLPVVCRVSMKLADMLLAIEEVETDLSTPEATPLRWIVPDIREARTLVCHALERLAS